MAAAGRIKAWIIWLVAASFYSYEFFLRISPNVMVADLQRAFSINFLMIGNLSAFYYYAYASMQIPAGLLLDRFGIRPLLTIAAILVASGSLLFAHTSDFDLALAGRLLMGIGSAFSFIGCLKLARNWFPRRQFAIVVGLTNALGVIGALWGQVPLALLVNAWGWRQTLSIAGIAGALLAILIRIVVRDKPHVLGGKPTYSSTIIIQWKKVLKMPEIWITAAYGGLMVAPISAFTELWGVPFFIQTFHLTRVGAAELSSLMFIGIALGGPLNAWLAGKWQRRKLIMQLGCVGALSCFLLVIYASLTALILVSVLLVLFGLFTSSMLLAFAINTERHSTSVSGLIIGFTNMLVMLGGTLFQPLVGFLLDCQPASGIKLWQYQESFFCLPLCQLVAFCLTTFMRELPVTR